MSRRLIASVLVVLCLSACASTPRQDAARDARSALTEYARRFNTVDVVFGTAVLNYFGQARWSGTPGLCEADLLTVVPGRKANGRSGGVRSIDIETLYRLVGDTTAEADEPPQILAQEAACAAITDTRTFFTVEGDDEELAVSGAVAYRAVIQKTACGSVPTCGPDAPAVLRELAAFPLGAVKACGDSCLRLSAGDAERREITVWHEPRSAAAIVRFEIETQSWLD